MKLQSSDLTQLSISEAAARLRIGELSPVALVEAHLERIAAEDERLRSYITVCAVSAREAAQQAEREMAAGLYRGALHGIPLAHKDCFESAGVRTTGGSILLKDFIPTESAAALQRLERVGAILLGKLNMHEWAMSVTNDNPFYGRCRNPHDLSRIPGGSSGGSGAAVAAGLCMGSLGTDAGGSVRLPAALCGVVGFKPSFGRISRRGVLPMSFSLDHVGILARTVDDVALLYGATAGYDAEDAFSLRTGVEVPAIGKQYDVLKGLRVGVAIEGFNRDGKRSDDEVIESVWARVHEMERRGALVREVQLPRMDEAARAVFTMIVTEAAEVHAERLRAAPAGYSAETRASLERGQRTPGTVYAQARKLQVELARHLEVFFEEVDILITPTSPVPAPMHDEPAEAQRARLSLLAYTAPFNLTGNPALSIPCGMSREGLPIGIQLVGAFGEDAHVLEVGRAVE